MTFNLKKLDFVIFFR